MEIIEDSNGNVLWLTTSALESFQIANYVQDPACGAISTFIGVTRNNFEGKIVTYLEYECYNDMALKEMRKICETIRENHCVSRIAIFHRLGRVNVGEASVLIAVSSAHRAPAMHACTMTIDLLKERVPIWKKEYYSSSSTGNWKANSEFDPLIASART